MYYKGLLTSRIIWIQLVFLCILSCSRSEAPFDNRPTFDFEINGVKAVCKVACDPLGYSIGMKGVEIDKLFLPDKQAKGLCFVFPSNRIMVFTMSDVSFPLELILASYSGEISYIITMTANSKQFYSAPEPARIAMEFPVGFSKETEIKSGDQLLSQQDIRKLQKICGF